jgi:hypothetical protein
MFFDTRECEWSDQEVFIDGVRVTKIQGIKFKPTQEKEFLHAAGNEPIGIQRGNKTYTGDITLLKGALDDINRAVRAAGGNDILDAEFVVVVNYKAKGNRALQTNTLIGMQVSEYEHGMEQNAKSKPITLPMMFLKLIST